MIPTSEHQEGRVPARDIKIALFGTSRLHRPFARQQADGPRLNYSEASAPIFMRMGYFHGGAEITQKIEVLLGERTIPRTVLPFAFRVENRTTTPMNEFDAILASAVRSGSDFAVDEPRESELLTW